MFEYLERLIRKLLESSMSMAHESKSQVFWVQLQAMPMETQKEVDSLEII